MLFDWSDYLSVAKNLKAKTDGQPHTNANEAIQRTAISRAYYSAYHLAVNYAINNLGYKPEKNGPNQYHADIQGIYRRQLSNPDHQEIKTILYRLNKARKDSDYESDSLGNAQALLASIISEADKVKAILRY